MRSVSIFGSTGSIGQNTVDLLTRQGGAAAYRVEALTGAANVALLAQQARALGARLAVTSRPENYAALKEALAGSGVAVAAGPDAVVEAADRPVDWAMSAIVGAAGLAPSLRAARHGGVLALANKESLVCAGSLLQETCRRHGTRLVPVDSEHSAIFQCLTGERAETLERIVLTASGGPFRDWSRAQMAAATPAEAKAHPNWSMGVRISIDSATMFNKALEIVEAQVLFGLEPGQIEVVVHPQSIVHSMVGFADGAVMAQLGPPDMRGAIGFALNWPDRRPLPVERLDFAKLARLEFFAEDRERFPALGLAREVLARGGLTGAVFNAAKEAALDAFLAEKIGFLDMADLVGDVLEAVDARAATPTLEDAFAAVQAYDSAARAAGAAWAARHGSAPRARAADGAGLETKHA